MSEPFAAPSTVGNEVGPQCLPLFGRPTPRAPRSALGGILPVTNGRFVKEQTGHDLDERPHSFSMSPNQAICSEKSIVFSPLAARALTIRSWPEALDARDLSRACRKTSKWDAYPLIISFSHVRPGHPSLPPGGPVSRWYTDFLQRAPSQPFNVIPPCPRG